MRRIFWLALVVSAGCASPKAAKSIPAAAEPPRFLPAAVYSGGDGTSIETAVIVTAESEDEGINREYEWIFGRYGKFRKTGVGLATVGERKYDVVRVELADHSEKQIFFDITWFFGKSGDK